MRGLAQNSAQLTAFRSAQVNASNPAHLDAFSEKSLLIWTQMRSPEHISKGT